jgi:hypothetical protein
MTRPGKERPPITHYEGFSMSNNAQQYPNGKLNESDDGALAMTVGTDNGRVRIHFHKPIQWVAFPPEQAVELAQCLIKVARQLGFSKTVTLEI